MIYISYKINGTLEYSLYDARLYSVEDARREFRKRFPRIKILACKVLDNVRAI